MISLQEYRPDVINLSPVDLAHLLRLVKASSQLQGTALIESLVPTGRADYYDIRPGPYVGRIGLPTGLTIDIRSRFPFDDVVDLLRLSGQLPLLRERLAAEQEATHFIVEAIAMALVREVDRIVGRGLAKGYRTFAFTEPPYPGVPDVSAHLSRFAGRADRLVTRARRISADVEVNRALALVIDLKSSQPTSGV
jgi:5-methylcytosine-specific restriction enzyme subunit McrC